MNLDNTPTGQVDELTALFVIMFWGQPMVDLIERARKALLMPDAKDSAVCQMAIAIFARDLYAHPTPVVPWEHYNTIHSEVRRLKKKKEITYGEGTLELIEKVGLKIEQSGVDFKNVRRDGAINKPLVILCALLWVVGEGK